MTCIFCEIIESSKEKSSSQLPFNVFLNNEFVVGFMDIQPLVSSSAHVLIVPRKHYSTMDEMSNDVDTAGGLGIALAKVSKALVEIQPKSHQPPSFNIIQNNGIGAGQIVNHVHFHIVIRGVNDQQSKAISEIMLRQSELTFRERMSYTARIFGRGAREDLDSQWAQDVTNQLRERLSGTEKNESYQSKI